MKYIYILFTFLSLTIHCSESLEQWICDKISEYNVPEPEMCYFVDDGDYYSYILGYKHAYQDMLKKVRYFDIKELEMAD